MSDLFGDTTPPAKPVRVNLKAVVGAGALGALLVGGMIYYTQFHSEKQRAVAEREKSTVSTKPQQMAGSFPTDYTGDRSAAAAPAKQPAPPAPATTAPPPAPAIAPAHAITPPAEPPKPMAPMFVNGKDPAIAALAQEEGGNAGGRRLAGNRRSATIVPEPVTGTATGCLQTRARASRHKRPPGSRTRETLARTS